MNAGHHRHVGGRRLPGAMGTALLAAVIVAGVWLLTGSPGPGDSPVPERRVVDVEMEMTGFEPSVIRVRAGETFTLRLQTPESPFAFEGPTHQLAIDKLGVDLRIGAGDAAETTVTVTEPGRYEFYCDLCCSGRANPSMIGELIVTG